MLFEAVYLLLLFSTLDNSVSAHLILPALLFLFFFKLLSLGGFYCETYVSHFVCGILTVAK